MPSQHLLTRKFRLIVGGGGAGLTASMLLARHGVEHLLVGARRRRVLPKATS